MLPTCGSVRRSSEATAASTCIPDVVATIQKQPNANTLEVTAEIEAALAALKATLPDDVTIDTKAFQQASFINRAIDNVKEALLEGGLLVAVVLFLFLWNFRTTFISLTAIPLSLVTAVIAMTYFGVSINTMTLGGLAIAIGELVDDAIVDVENVFRRLEAECAVRHAGITGSRDFQGVERDPQLDRLRDADHHPGVPSAVQPGRLRRPDVRAAGVCLYRLDRGVAARRADRDAGALLLPAWPFAQLVRESERFGLVQWLKRHYAEDLSWTLRHPTADHRGCRWPCW